MGAVDRRSGRDPEFEAFVAGAAGRLLHVAVLLTAEPLYAAPAGASGGASGRTPAATAAPAARRILASALARTYAHWERLRGDDPYDHTRQELCAAYARTARRLPPGTGVLARLGPLERLVLVMRVYEGVAEEVTAAQLGLTPERVEAVCNRAVATMRAPAQEAA
ncbi:DNA-directed RNA polymerase sigma-70 factor [Streptomyces lavendulae subsp. lavendulae]|uniref:RNA polymerase n=1 Tax=Streptomyces lavendulae TaxID=1914 RepID=UPI0024A11404|nr:DNA-directed RNA polymerase sigma-70 factor [Streptomyces lavendulae subsp. lavendulae]